MLQGFLRTIRKRGNMKKQYYCNPLNMDYRYQFIEDMRSGEDKISREAADPSMILFQGKYYIFASMTLSVWVSEDMVHWESHRLPDSLPLYDYAPDVRVVGDYVYFSASRRGTICDFYRTKDILNGPFERIPGTFDFWDPNLFLDDDGKLYFYWGCNNVTPIWGVELEPETMVPKTERKELIYGQPEKIGYERVGENHSKMPLSEEEAVEKFKEFLKAQGKDADHLTEEQIGFAKIMFSQRPFIEGAWMTKHDGTYYLQYAGPGTEYNVTVTVFMRAIPRLARSIWQRIIHIPINRADSCAVQATVQRWKTAMETGGIPRQYRSAKTTIWSVASASGGQASTKMVSCSAISSSATGRWRWSRQKKTRGQNRSGIS